MSRNVKVQFAVSQKVAEGKCAPQVGVRGLPTHESGKPRSRGVASTVTFKFKDGTEGALMIRDNGNAHQNHQSTEVQMSTFARIFGALKNGGVTKPVMVVLDDTVAEIGELAQIEF